MQGKRYSELGSEFWLEKESYHFPTYVLSGRTAIDLILQDMMAEGKSIRTVYMPAYCCDSMLQPFLDRNVQISFYDISWFDGHLVLDIDRNHKTDILYITNYFGYDNTPEKQTIRSFKEQDSTVIYDRTHSLFRKEDKHPDWADYMFASIRKWLGVPCGALVAKRKGQLALPELKEYPHLEGKLAAMTMKAAYIEEKNEELKKQFLQLFNTFSHQLATDYRDYKIDELSRNIWAEANKTEFQNSRRENAAFLQKEIKRLPGINPLFKLGLNDCPLFVPILFESKGERDKVRSYLTSQSIYCPVHWPMPSTVDSDMDARRLYDCELSLLCDQRYGLVEMKRILDALAACNI